MFALAVPFPFLVERLSYGPGGALCRSSAESALRLPSCSGRTSLGRFPRRSSSVRPRWTTRELCSTGLGRLRAPSNYVRPASDGFVRRRITFDRFLLAGDTASARGARGPEDEETRRIRPETAALPDIDGLSSVSTLWSVFGGPIRDG